jgi:hypothetical protein
MTSADLTRRELSFGAADPTTGWYAKVYAESTIEGVLQPQGASMSFLPCGSYAKYPHTLFTEYVVHEGDQIVDANLAVYELNTVSLYSWLDMFSHRTCEAVKQEFDNRDATSGSWHLDGDSLTTDPRSRHKILLDTYLGADNFITCFDGADYPIKYLFLNTLGINTEVVISIGKEAATPLLDFQDKPYAYIETVPINIYAVDKVGHTATNSIEQKEQEIRHILTDYATVEGRSLRSIQSTKHTPTDLGNKTSLWCTTLTIKYTRSNDDFTPTAPTITYANDQFYTFTFPNCLDIQFRDPDSGDVILHPPGRLGGITQVLGMSDFEITFTCDLTINPDNTTWKRPQGSLPKTDLTPFQVFQEMKFDHKYSATAEYQNLNWGAGSTVPVRLVDYSVQDNKLTLTFRRYSATSATSYKDWFGIG